MKQLIIIRHAQAEADFGSDKDRHLTEYGETEAAAMAALLKKQGYRINKIFTSPADRTLETTVHFAQANHLEENDIVIFENLYLGDTLQIIEAVKWLKQDINTLAIIAHNPGVTNFTNDVTGAALEHFPTCGVAIIEGSLTNWDDYETHPKKLVEMLAPEG